MKIEYLSKFRRLGRTGSQSEVLSMLKARHGMCREYSFAVPTRRAVIELSKMSPLVELGAGNGYWAMLISQTGGEVLAVDKCPGEGNKYSFSKFYGQVTEGDEKVLSSIGDHFNLFLCWPNYNNDFAYNCLSRFQGNKLAYIGEDEGGCTANSKFFELLGQKWTRTLSIPLPQWPGIHDYLSVYERNGEF